MARHKRLSWPVAVCLALGACTVIERFDDRGNRLERAVTFGPARLPDMQDRSYVLRQRGLGLAAGAARVIVGWSDTQLIRIARDCAAIFIVPDGAPSPRLLQTAGDSAKVCAIEGPQP